MKNSLLLMALLMIGLVACFGAAGKADSTPTQSDSSRPASAKARFPEPIQKVFRTVSGRIRLAQNQDDTKAADENNEAPPKAVNNEATPKADTNEAPPRKESPAEAAIRASEKAFSEAFNKGDAEAVAARWTAEGDYVDENGQSFRGRDAIEKEYATFFAQNPGIKIHITIDSIRLIGEEMAIEDGRAQISPAPAGAPAVSRYTAVHVKQDGKWLMTSVRDMRVETTSNFTRLEDLEWLIGKWSAEHEGVRLEVTCQWIANKSFLQRSSTVTESGQVTSSAAEIIGWNPVNGQVSSWTFSSSGGYAIGVWSPHDSGWMIETAGVMSDGTETVATNVLSRLDDDAMSWQSVDRAAGEVRLSDVEEVVLKRK